MTRRAGSLPPGPTPLLAPLLAASLQRDPLRFLRRCRNRHGDLFTLPFGTAMRRTVWVCDPVLAQQLLDASADELLAGRANAILEPIVGSSSTLLLDGDDHAARRTLLAPEFDHGRLDHDRELITSITAAELSAWDAGALVPLWSWARRLTMKIMVRVVFGVRSARRSGELETRLTALVERGGSLPMIMPALRVNFGPLSPWGSFLRRRGELDELLMDEIRAHRADPLLDQRTDVVSLAIRAQCADGSMLTDAEVRDEIVTLAVAGCETSAGGLAWALELLLRHPAELAEVRDALERGDNGYLELAIDEALRLRSPLFALGRATPDEYPFGRYVLPPGTGLMAPLLLLYRSPSLYRNPTLYRPRRFLAGEPRPRWVPFGAGIRACLGAAFAKLQIATALEQILSSYEVRLEDPRPERIRLRSAALVVPDREVPLRVVRPLGAVVGQRAEAVETRDEEVFAAAHGHE